MGKLKQWLLGNRPQQLTRDEQLEANMNYEYDRYCDLRAKWTTGERNAEMQTIKEWEFLNKPTKD